MEFNWERVLNYILLKTLRHSRFRAYAEEKLGDSGVEYFILFENRIQQNLRRICVQEGVKGMFLKNAFESMGVVCDPLLQDHLNLMKQEYELKILFHFFGCKFQHHYDSVLPTGAISFKKKEVKDSTGKDFQQKIQILEQAIQTKSPILLGLNDHWMVVRNVKSFIDESQGTEEQGAQHHKYFAYALDPLAKQEKTYPFERINEKFLFYIFDHEDAALRAGLQVLDEVLTEDFPKDAAIYQQFLANEIGDAEPLKQQLAEMFGMWPPLEEERMLFEEAKEIEEEFETMAEEGLDTAMKVDALNGGNTGELKSLPTEEEMAQRLRAAIKKGFSDYSKV
ncbi:MAG: hypothetical protein RBG13Loki_1703 [Promethearchaeota archaeon CR_4]|nr:MAG: hypothetical protein RBG13Loki_1703 [Candidatus Lokiarchaeota archaeon CR_4]